MDILHILQQQVDIWQSSRFGRRYLRESITKKEYDSNMIRM